ncbi:hypothetical protein [Biomaibacter acetigenes]|nr:hypothetical protein [Biomaibacter acetigenes]
MDYENEILKYTDEKGDIKYRDPDEVQRKHIFELMAKRVMPRPGKMPR